MNYWEMKTKYCSFCKNNSTDILNESCFSCLCHGTSVNEMPNFIRKDVQNMNISLSDTEKMKLEEVGKAMSLEEMSEIIKTMPPEIIIKEVARRFKKMETIKEDLNRIYGTLSNETSNLKSIDTTLADFSRH